MDRIQFDSGTNWEPIVGYSRAIRVDKVIYVSGTTATNENNELVGVDDAYIQAQQAIQNIENALLALGSSLADVVRTRMYVIDIKNNWQDVGRAHGEAFGDIRPATSMVQVSGLIDPDMLVEIEAVAILSKEIKETSEFDI